MFYTTNDSLPVPIPFKDLNAEEQKKHLEGRRIFMEFLMKMHMDLKKLEENEEK